MKRLKTAQFNCDSTVADIAITTPVFFFCGIDTNAIEFCHLFHISPPIYLLKLYKPRYLSIL